MRVLTARQERSVALRQQLRDELRRRLDRPASAAHIGVAFESPAMAREWLIPCSPAMCSVPPYTSLIACTQCAAQRIVRFTFEGSSSCQIVLCAQDADASSQFDCIQELATAVAEIQEVISREDPLLQELAASWETLATLYESSLDLQSCDNLQKVTDRLLDRSVAAGSDVCALLWILEQDEFRVVAGRRCQLPTSRSVSQGLLAVARERAIPVVLDGCSDPLVNVELEPELRDAGPIALIPVRTRQGLEVLLQVWRGADGAPFETPAVRLLEAIALQAASAIENDRLYHAALEGERMRQEIEIGASIQQHLLLGEHPQDIRGVEIANYMLPSLQVGGDFYQFVSHSATCFDAIVGDVMGKGIGAALMGAATKSTLLRVIAERNGGCDVGCLPQPADIVTRTNRDMSRELVQLDSFVTLFYARIDLEPKTLTYVDAGHTQTLHYIQADGSINLLRGKEFPLGFSGAETYQQSVVKLAPGDIVFIYSDGLSEASDPSGQLYGVDRIRHFLQRNATLSASEIANRISDEVRAFRASTHLDDDLTCLVIKVCRPLEAEGTADSMDHRLVIAGNVNQLERLRDWLAKSVSSNTPVPLSDDTLFKILLAVQEAATNVMFHGLQPQSSQDLTVQIRFERSALSVEIVYEGASFSPESVPAPSFDGSRDHGFGMFLIDQLMDEVSYTFTQGRNAIRLVKQLDRPKE